MVSDAAITLMEQIALSVGFGPGEDYPHLGASPISAGNWKGSNVAACVFAYAEHAEKYLDKCLSDLVS